MRLLIIIVALVLLLGPLRHWAGRHWGCLLSLVIGGLFGLLMGAWVVGSCGGPAFLPLLWAAVGAIAFARTLPAHLHKLGKDGRDDDTPRRH